jgi:tetratricopeptide (TPR) repeat protein
MRRRHRIDWRPFAVCLALFLLAVAAFWQVTECEFVNYDDDEYVTENPRVVSGLSFDNFIWAFTTGHAGNWHPLAWLSHQADAQLFGLKPRGHHSMNLLFHAANAVLLFLLLNRATKKFWASAFVAAVFAVHPLNVESVAWVAERKNVLSTFLWLLTLIAYVRFAETQQRRFYALSLLLFALGLMAKPMLVTVPFVLLLLDWWPLRRLKIGETSAANPSPPIAPQPLRRVLLEKIPFLTLAGVVCVVTVYVQSLGGAVRTTEEFSLWLRVINAMNAYATYLWKIFAPTHLAVFYPFDKNPSVWRVILSAVVLAAISIAAARLWRKKPSLTCGWLWFVGVLVPVIGIVQVGGQAMADRHAYVPMIGILVAATWGVLGFASKVPAMKFVLPALGAIIIGAFGYATFVQTTHWQNSVTLFERALAVTAENPVAHNNLGLALAAQEKFDEAIAHYEKAAQADPKFARAFNNWGLALAAQGKHELAMRRFGDALRMDPDYDKAHINLGSAYAKRGNLQQASAHFQEALRINPDSHEALNNLGNVLLMQGKPDAAMGQYVEALRRNPRYAEARNNLGYCHAMMGQLDKAIANYRDAVRLKPDYAQAHNNLAIAFLATRKIDEAIEHFRAAIRHSPRYVEPLGRLATIRASHPNPRYRDGAEALRLAQQACDLTENKHPLLLATLATAQAESGQFPDAIATAEKAQQIASASGQRELVKILDDQLKLYREGKPFRMTETPKGAP